MWNRLRVFVMVSPLLVLGCRRKPTPENIAGTWEYRQEGLVARWELTVDGAYAMTSTLSAKVSVGAKEDTVVREKGAWAVKDGKLVVRVTKSDRLGRWQEVNYTRKYKIESLKARSVVIARERKLGGSAFGHAPPMELTRVSD